MHHPASRRIATPAATRVLLAEVVDYAGLFPPAALDMRSAVGNFARYLGSDEAWALGRFIVPLGRLDEFAASHAALGAARPAAIWRLSVLAAETPALDAERIRAFAVRHDPREVVIDTLERRVGSADEISGTVAATPADVRCYLELPPGADLEALVAATAAAGARAKIRTGGTEAHLIPPPVAVLRFLRACQRHGVAFKATAGLHHPLRGSYPLTYERDSARGTMFGYLNVLIAAAFLHAGMDDATALALLDETEPAAFDVTDTELRWRGHGLDLAALRAARAHAAIAFGSCSFREPMDEARELGIL